MIVDEQRLRQEIEGLIERLGSPPVGSFVWYRPYRVPRKALVDSYIFWAPNNTRCRIYLQDVRSKEWRTAFLADVFLTREECEAWK